MVKQQRMHSTGKGGGEGPKPAVHVGQAIQSLVRRAVVQVPVLVYDVNASTVTQEGLFLRGEKWVRDQHLFGGTLSASALGLDTCGFEIVDCGFHDTSYNMQPVLRQEFLNRAEAVWGQEAPALARDLDQNRGGLKKFIGNTVGIRHFGRLHGAAQMRELCELREQVLRSHLADWAAQYYGVPVDDLVASVDMHTLNTEAYNPAQQHMHVDYQLSQQLHKYTDMPETIGLQMQTCTRSFSVRNVASLGMLCTYKQNVDGALEIKHSNHNANIRTTGRAAEHQAFKSYDLASPVRKRSAIVVFEGLHPGQTIVWKETTIHGTIPAMLPRGDREATQRTMACVNLHPGRRVLEEQYNYTDFVAAGGITPHSVFSALKKTRGREGVSLQSPQLQFHPSMIGVDSTTDTGKQLMKDIQATESRVRVRINAL